MRQREVPNYWPGKCFGCSPRNHQGLQLRFWLSENGCFTRCSVPSHLCGFDGLVHGGIISTLLDEVGAWTIIARLQRFGITRGITVRFLRPVPTEVELLVEGEIISHDDRSAVLHSTVNLGDGELLAEADANWMLPSLSTIARLSGVKESELQRILLAFPREQDEVS